ncbi:MAG TPA: hypothetical protein VFI47_15435 [Acidimicrobiales bacterium]|nr:hypothetical protein [Acidimicrobiales bacterium]
MRTIRRRRVLRPVLAMLAHGLALAPARSLARPEAASAGSGWLGTCYAMQGDANNGGGWCDGNGPDATYFGFAVCVSYDDYWTWYKAYGVERWAGDRRGSYASCATGYYVERTGVEAWFYGYMQVRICDVGGWLWYEECPGNVYT